MLLDPTWIIPGPRSLVQLDVHKLCHPSEAPGDMYSLPTPRHHHMAIKSEYVGTEVRKQGILRHPGDASKVWELAPQGTALLLLTPCCGGRTVKQLASWLQEEHCHVSLSVLDEQIEQWMGEKKLHGQKNSLVTDFH